MITTLETWIEEIEIEKFKMQWDQMISAHSKAVLYLWSIALSNEKYEILVWIQFEWQFVAVQLVRHLWKNKKLTMFIADNVSNIHHFSIEKCKNSVQQAKYSVNILMQCNVFYNKKKLFYCILHFMCSDIVSTYNACHKENDIQIVSYNLNRIAHFDCAIVENVLFHCNDKDMLVPDRF